MQKILLIILSLIIFINAQDQIYPPPTALVTIPTAGSLNRGAFSASMRMQKDGGLLNSLSVGFSDRFMFGISLGASNLTLNRVTLQFVAGLYTGSIVAAGSSVAVDDCP